MGAVGGSRQRAARGCVDNGPSAYIFHAGGDRAGANKCTCEVDAQHSFPFGYFHIESARARENPRIVDEAVWRAPFFFKVDETCFDLFGVADINATCMRYGSVFATKSCCFLDAMSIDVPYRDLYATRRKA